MAKGRSAAAVLVEDIMTREVEQVSPDDVMAKVAQRMLDRKIHGVTVTDNGKLLQVVTTFDILKVVFMESYNRSHSYTFSKVRDFMPTRPLISISPFDTVADAHALFVEKNIRFIPVVDHGELVGVLTLMDVARFLKDAADG